MFLKLTKEEEAHALTQLVRCGLVICDAQKYICDKQTGMVPKTGLKLLHIFMYLLGGPVASEAGMLYPMRLTSSSSGLHFPAMQTL